MCRDLRRWLLSLLAFFSAFAVIQISAEDPPKASTNSAGNVEVVAEGAGTTPDEALKDAFRNAVRQVVGAVVDAETLVKNDEIIDDQILTYSNGFVKKFTEVPGSKKQQAGLHRIKIKAEVERKNLIAKLKAAKVTMKGLDGKSLFAEAVTLAEAEQNSTKLLVKALSDLPKVLTATVQGKPHYDRDTSEFFVDVMLEVDMKVYRDFTTRLQETLQKISLAKETLQVKGIPAAGQKNGEIVSLTAQRPGATELLGPKISADKGKVWCLWVCASSANNHSQLRWNGYVIDAEISTTVLPFMTPHGRSPAIRPKTIVRISLLDSDEGVVVEDEFELTTKTSSPWLVAVVPRYRDRPSSVAGVGYAQIAEVVKSYEIAAQQDIKNQSVNVYLAPHFDPPFNYKPKQLHHRRIKVSLDELKRIQDVRCSVVYMSEAATAK